MVRTLVTGSLPHLLPTQNAYSNTLQHTGGSGFIATHVIEALLKGGHSVVTTVRTPEKGQSIKDLFPNVPKEKLDFVIVKDIAQPDGTPALRYV